MIELSILKLFLTRELFTNYAPYVDYKVVKEQTPDIGKMFAVLQLWFEEHQESLTSEEFEVYYRTLYPVLKPKEKEVVDTLFQTFHSLSVNESLLVGYLEQLKRDQILNEVALMTQDIKTGSKRLDDLFKAVESLSDISVENAVKFVTSDLEELYNETIAKPGLRWRLKTLNRMLGSLRQGDFGFVFARPETGKTTFLASEITYMAGQAERPIVWFNNEEQGSKVMLRCYQAALGMEAQNVYLDIAGNRKKYQEATKDNIKIYDAGSIHRKQVEDVCSKINPSLIIFDQIDKLKGWKDDRDDIMLKEMYQWGRELSKEYGPVIGVCQAGGSGEGKKWLTMDDVDRSKTAKQGEADWILGIGKTHDEELEYVRHFHISKNKLMGDEDTLPELRHGKVDVRIFPAKGRYEDIL